MKPGDTPSLKEVLDPDPGPLVTSVEPLAQPVPIVVRDDFGFFGEANVIAAAINSATGRRRLPCWIRFTAYAIAGLMLAQVVLAFF